MTDPAYQVQAHDPEQELWVNIIGPTSSLDSAARLADELALSADARVDFCAPQTSIEFRVLDRSKGSVVHEATTPQGPHTFYEVDDEGGFRLAVGLMSTLAELAAGRGPTQKHLDAILQHFVAQTDDVELAQRLALNLAYSSGRAAGRAREERRVTHPTPLPDCLACTTRNHTVRFRRHFGNWLCDACCATADDDPEAIDADLGHPAGDPR